MAVLWQHVTNYVAAGVRALRVVPGAEVLVVQRAGGNRDHSGFAFQDGENGRFIDLTVSSRSPREHLQDLLAFGADIAVVSLSRSGLYRDYARQAVRQGTLVVGASDAFWRGTWRDWANAAYGRLGGFSPYHALWVPGARGRRYARRLGFAEETVFEGVYTCDQDLFSPIGRARHAAKTQEEVWPAVFLFVGQLIERKGLDTLARAYGRYRRAVTVPWELWLAGSGPRAAALRSLAGVRLLGNLEPAACAAAMARSGALVLPSYYDAWGVVIHEAVSAGLPVIASTACGASSDLIRDGVNGLCVPSGDSAALAQAMAAIARPERARPMGCQSQSAARQYSPTLWAQRIVHDIPLGLRGEPLVCPGSEAVDSLPAPAHEDERVAGTRLRGQGA